jgi:hypothetical protein
MVQSQMTPPSLLGSQPGPLVLRLRGTTRNGQIIRLNSPKCTLGSGPRCTLRLCARGVQPLHCVVFRGSRATVVRRWSMDTRLNGGWFTDAELRPGDRLSLGPIELEVVETGRGHGLPPSEDAAPADQVAHTTLPATEASNAEATPPSAAPAGLAGERQQFEREQRRRQQSLADREVWLTQQAEQLDRRKAQLESRQARWDSQRVEAERRLRQRSEELETQASALRTDRDRLEQGRRELESLRTGQGPYLGVSAAAPAVGPESEPPDEPIPELVELPAFDPPAGDSPVSVGHVLERLGTSPAPGADPAAGEGTAIQRHGSPAAAVPTSQAAGTSARAADAEERGETAEEESIDDYMTRLIARLRSGKGQRQTPGQYEQPATDGPPDAQRDQNPTPETAAKASAGPAPADLSPRAVAPEKTVGLTAMRELAILSAQSAIDRHARGKMVRLRRGKLLLGLSGLAAGGAMLWIWHTYAAGGTVLWAAVISLSLALFWVVQCAVLSGYMGRGRKPQADRAAPEAGKPAATSAEEAASTPVEAPCPETPEVADVDQRESPAPASASEAEAPAVSETAVAKEKLEDAGKA